MMETLCDIEEDDIEVQVAQYHAWYQRKGKFEKKQVIACFFAVELSVPL